jgi:hypothetical protein
MMPTVICGQVESPVPCHPASDQPPGIMPRMEIRRRLNFASIVCLASLTLAAVVHRASAAERTTFERDVRPILKTYCLDCHGGEEKVQARLDLRLKRFAEKGGDSGPAIVPGNPADSLLIERLKAGEMPPGEKKVPPEQIAVIEKWIAEGAVTVRVEPEQLPPGIDITPEERAYWAFQPLSRPKPPQFPLDDRIRTPIDAFVLAKLREKKLSFAPEADRITLMRRAAFDLTGLPPSQQEIDAFLADNSDQAYERMIDRLLESPHYGERWARHWLDVVGYADSEGNGTEDTPRQFAYKYRDYVIRSLNADKPFDQFLIEQLAGDELVPQPWTQLPPEQLDKLIATGFLRMAADPTATGGGDQTANANQVMADTIKIVSSSLLGLSVGCAQCHDHKYDPIPQVDYFRMRAIFEPALDPAHWRRPSQRLVSLYTDADRAKAAAVEAEAGKMQQELNAKTEQFIAKAFDDELMKFPEEMREKLRATFQTPPDKHTEEQKQLYAANPRLKISAGVLYQYDQKAADELKKDAEKIAAKRAERPPEDFISITNEVSGTIPETHLFHRGDYRQPKDAVLPGDLTIAAPEGARLEIAPNDAQLPTTGRRLAFAKHLTSGKHPLLGRVLMNRIWLHHFGRGLVDTPGEFGILGVRPTHPELLDWLADELAASHWSLKEMHRLIMTSTVYRQSSRHEAAQDAVDTDNALYGRFPILRLDAEALRDRVLAISGRIDRTQFGPAIPVTEDFVGQVLPANDSARRSVYLQVRRTKPVSFLTAFDAPVMTVNCDRRIASTSAPQALMLMNSDFVLGHANAFAQRMRDTTPADYAPVQTAPFAQRVRRDVEYWQYGYGMFDESTKRIVQFTPLQHWTGSAWQGGAQLPDAGNDAQHASIRRWIAPHDGVVAITGKLKHGSDAGDGVRARLVSSRSGLHGEWSAKKSEAATDVARIEVVAGDTLDLAVDCVANVTSDSYEWAATLKLADRDGKLLSSWNSSTDFHGPIGASWPQWIAHAWQSAYLRPITTEELDWACEFVARQSDHLRSTGTSAGDIELSVLTNLCQQLFNSNEFLYVD